MVRLSHQLELSSTLNVNIVVKQVAELVMP